MRTHKTSGLTDDLLRDIKVSFRSLRRTPGFALVSILTVALGVGTTTAVFSLVDGILLRPLPYPNANALVRIYERSAKYPASSFSGANFHDLEQQTKTLRSVAFFSDWQQTVLGLSQPLRVDAAAVSTHFFDVLGVSPAQGRAFLPDEGREGSARTMVISDRFWRTTLGSRSDWRELNLHTDAGDGRIVGIMPPDFAYPATADIWTASTDDNPHRTAHNWSVIGRLRPGKTIEDSRIELNQLFGGLKAQLGKEIDAEGVTIRTLRESLTMKVRTLSFVLLAAVVLVLLVACINLASANLARGEAQQRELAVRASLGAGRARLIRQLATEKIVLCTIGGLLAIGLAWALVRVAVSLGSATLPAFASLEVDAPVMIFGLVMAIVTGLVTGIFPALRITADLRGATLSGGGSGKRHSFRGPLIATEVALATMLLIGAGLFLRSFETLVAEDPGYRVQHLILADVTLPSAGYRSVKGIGGDTLAMNRFYSTALAKLRQIPGADAVALVNQIPLGGGGMGTGFMIDGGTDATGNGDYRVVDSAYFAAMGIPVLKGRGFTSFDKAGAEHVVVINRNAAEKFWPGVDPIGHRIRPPGMDSHASLWLTVVGVVENVRQYGLDQPVSPQMYVNYLQRPERLFSGTFVVRTNNSAAVTPAVRAAVSSGDPNALVEVSSMQALLEQSVAGRKFSMTVLSAFSSLALFLAAVGIYGVLAYAVVQRQREIGLRMALGATRGGVRGLIVNDALRAVIPGLVIGLFGAFLTTRLIAGMLYGVAALDPVTFAVTPFVILIVSVGASLWPAARAAAISPMVAMRAE